MNKIIKFSVIVSLFIVSCLSLSINIHAKSISNNSKKETISLVLNNEIYNYELVYYNDNVNITIKDSKNNIISYVFIENNTAYEMVDGVISEVAYFENKSQEVSSEISPLIAVNWGPLISNRTRVTIPNPESSAISTIAGILISAVFPPASIPMSIVIGVAEYYNAYHPRYIDQTVYYHEAIGCPQYRWIKKYEARNSSGTIIKTTTMDSKKFYGITHSPQNPPACTVYGF